MATQTALHLCPQCGDECLPDAVLCDGCWHELQPSHDDGPQSADVEASEAADAIYHALGGGLAWLTCRRLASQGFRAV